MTNTKLIIATLAAVPFVCAVGVFAGIASAIAIATDGSGAAASLTDGVLRCLQLLAELLPDLPVFLKLGLRGAEHLPGRSVERCRRCSLRPCLLGFCPSARDRAELARQRKGSKTGPAAAYPKPGTYTFVVSI